LDANRKNPGGTDSRKPDAAGERRRISRVRHDERGNAYVEWIEAPAALVDRPKLEVQREPLRLEEERKSFDPYASAAGAARKSGSTTRTNLRQLSEWIKMMRELEERKRASGGEEE
jgi:hypothetical protein